MNKLASMQSILYKWPFSQQQDVPESLLAYVKDLAIYTKLAYQIPAYLDNSLLKAYLCCTNTNKQWYGQALKNSKYTIKIIDTYKKTETFISIPLDASNPDIDALNSYIQFQLNDTQSYNIKNKLTDTYLQFELNPACIHIQEEDIDISLTINTSDSSVSLTAFKFNDGYNTQVIYNEDTQTIMFSVGPGKGLGQLFDIDQKSNSLTTRDLIDLNKGIHSINGLREQVTISCNTTNYILQTAQSDSALFLTFKYLQA